MKHINTLRLHPFTPRPTASWSDTTVLLKPQGQPVGLPQSTELIEAMESFVDYYKHQRYHEPLSNMTPADFYYGRKGLILAR